MASRQRAGTADKGGTPNDYEMDWSQAHSQIGLLQAPGSRLQLTFPPNSQPNLITSLYVSVASIASTSYLFKLTPMSLADSSEVCPLSMARLDSSSRDIRILSLMPGQPADPIIYSLSKALLYKSPQYDALSYI